MNFVVTFTRTIEQTATIITDAPTQAQAEANARATLTDSDYGEAELIDEEVLVRQLKGSGER